MSTEPTILFLPLSLLSSLTPEEEGLTRQAGPSMYLFYCFLDADIYSVSIRRFSIMLVKMFR